MQSPIILFDHIKGVMTVVQQGPAQAKKLEELTDAQRAQIATSGGVPKR